MTNLLSKSLVGLFFRPDRQRVIGFLKLLLTLSNANWIVQSFCLTIGLHKQDVWSDFSLFMRSKIDIFGRSAI